MREELLHFERVMAKILCASDPIKARYEALQDAALTEEQRKKIALIDDDGLRMTALLVAKLRFERLLRGSAEAEGWFEENPREFSAAFKRYHQEVPPTAFFPPDEARLFEAWLDEPEAT